MRVATRTVRRTGNNDIGRCAMYEVRDTGGAIEVAQVLTAGDKVALVAFGTVFLVIGVCTVAWPFRLAWGNQHHLESLIALAIPLGLFGTAFAGLGLLLLLAVGKGDRTVRIDWERRVVADWRWHFRGGFQRREYPFAAIRSVRTARYADDNGPDTFSVLVQFADGAKIETVAAFKQRADANRCVTEIDRRR